MSNLDNETRKGSCPCDCWVESCLECTCCRCKDVWTEGTANTCEGSCEDCACEECCCEECTCDEECCDPWEETVCDPSGECTCEECCCEECTCDEECCDPWEETVCDPSGECTCEECCCEECTCDEECCDPWEETVCDPSGECTCEECYCEECTCDEECCYPWEETVCDPSGECTCEECCCEECICAEECCDPWEETVCDPSGECTCEECCCEECTCEKCCCKECTCKEWCDAWEEATCGSGMECTCEECCAPNDETCEEDDYYSPIDDSDSTQEPEVVEDDTGEHIEGDEYDNYEDTDDDYDYDPDEDENAPEIWDDTDYPMASLRIRGYQRFMKPGDTVQLIAVESLGHTAQKALWYSSDPDVVSVNENTGEAEALKKGAATISAFIDELDLMATCEITVDSRELVVVERVVEEDDDYFVATFEDGKIWRSIACDMENIENRSQLDIWNEDDEVLLPHEIRHRKNVYEKYSYRQLALLYRLDPYGVVAYVKDYLGRRFNGTLVEELKYKDDLYLEIFGTKEYAQNNFFFKVNSVGVPEYYRHTSYDELNRLHIHSKAELVFGTHAYVDPIIFGREFLIFCLNTIADYVFEKIGFDHVISVAENICNFFFFSKAITDGTEATVKLFWEKMRGEEQLVEILKEALPKWVCFVLGVVEALRSAYFPNRAKDLTFCQSVELTFKNLNYALLMKDGESQLLFHEIADILADE